MIRVTIEIVPYGEESKRRTIGTLTISRTTDHDNPEDYQCKISPRGDDKEAYFAVEQHRYEEGSFVLIKRAFEVFCADEEVTWKVRPTPQDQDRCLPLKGQGKGKGDPEASSTS